MSASVHLLSLWTEEAGTATPSSQIQSQKSQSLPVPQNSKYEKLKKEIQKYKDQLENRAFTFSQLKIKPEALEIDWTETGKIGEGGMGTIRKCWVKKDGKKHSYACKIIFGIEDIAKHLVQIRDFYNELRITTSLDHRYIIKISHWTIIEATNQHPKAMRNENFCIIMEEIKGCTLKDLIFQESMGTTEYQEYKNMIQNTPGHLRNDKINKNKGFEFDAETIVTILRQTYEALDYAQGSFKADTSGIQHTDIKPENIMLKYDIRINRNEVFYAPIHVKIIDWGTAKEISEQTRAEVRDFYSIYYSPREIDDATSEYHNDRYAYNKIDQYSLGVLTHEMVSREKYFGDDGKKKTGTERRKEILRLLRKNKYYTVPPKLRSYELAHKIIFKSLDYNPHARPTYEQLRKSLGKVERRDLGYLTDYLAECIWF